MHAACGGIGIWMRFRMSITPLDALCRYWTLTWQIFANSPAEAEAKTRPFHSLYLLQSLN